MRQKILKNLKEVNKDLEEIAKASLEFRANSLKAAYEEGWLKHLFIGAGLLGLGLVYHGLSNNNENTEYGGYGILAMDTLYTTLIYGADILNKTKNFINH